MTSPRIRRSAARRGAPPSSPRQRVSARQPGHQRAVAGLRRTHEPTTPESPAMRATVTTDPTTIAANPAADHPADRDDDYAARSFLVKRRPGAPEASVFVEIGGDASTSSSFEWEPTDPPLRLSLEPGEALSGIVAAGSQQLDVLAGGR